MLGSRRIRIPSQIHTYSCPYSGRVLRPSGVTTRNARDITWDYYLWSYDLTSTPYLGNHGRHACEGYLSVDLSRILLLLNCIPLLRE